MLDKKRRIARATAKKRVAAERRAGFRYVSVALDAEAIAEIDRVKEAKGFAERGSALNYIMTRLIALPPATKEELGL